MNTHAMTPLAPARAAPGSGLAGLRQQVLRALRRLQVDEREAYLSRSVDHVDLELRLKALERADRQPTLPWR